MKKYFTLIVLLFPVLFFIGWIGVLMHRTNEALTVEVPITGYDPRSLLPGHYLRYDINSSVLRTIQAHYPECQLPKSRERRYNIPEKQAPQLDALFRSNRHQFSIIFSCQEGHKAIAKELLIDGKDWHDIIEEK